MKILQNLKNIKNTVFELLAVECEQFLKKNWGYVKKKMWRWILGALVAQWLALLTTELEGLGSNPG